MQTVLWRRPTLPQRSHITAGAYAYIGIVLLWMLSRLTGDGAHPPYLYDVFLIYTMAMYFLSGLRLAPACAVGFGLWVAYLVAESRAGLSRPALLESGLFLFAANAAGAAARYVTEYLQRQQFLSSQLLAELASQDPLTGALNRRAFEAGLALAWRQAWRDGVPLTLATIDLDHFKTYNDRYGHAHGDALLVALTETLRDMAQRPLDLVGRLGGDEFVCLWYGVPEAGIAGFVAEVHATVNDRLTAELPDGAPPVSASLGAVHVLPAEAGDPLGLVVRADAALYHAKRSGRRCAALSIGEREPQVLPEHQ